MRRAKRLKIKGIYFLYRSMQGLAWPVILFYFLWRGMRKPAYLPTLPQRLGFLPRSFRQTTPGAIWLHAVSVGEVLASTELVRQLRERLPRSPVFLSTATLAGYATARDKLGDTVAGIFYAPLDYAFAVRAVLRVLRPSVVAVAETEIWPNLFREVKRTGAGLIVYNGRISDRALGRYTGLRAFFGCVLNLADTILVQSERMRERFIAAGALSEKVSLGGNLKYDFQPREAPPDSPVRALVTRTRPARVWIAASTMPPAHAGDVDEDDAVIAAFGELSARHAALLLILAPRKPERFDAAARKLDQAGIPFLRRSALGAGDALPLPGVLLLDTIGELSGLFCLADVVFMGGTLAQRGGHNTLEPALYGKPVVAGPHMENFRDIAAEFRAAGASVEIAGPAELAAAVDTLLASPGHAAQVGARALACARERGGATARVAARIVELDAENYPCYRPPLPARLLLAPLAKLWQWGGDLKRARGMARRRSLRAGVISVGNITMGGTGKTPAVLLLAGKMRAAGHRPGILTRGYGRHSPDHSLALAPGTRLSVHSTGDEPQMFLRSGVAPVGIGEDRYRTGRMLEDQFGVDLLILDDGFQHVRLARQADVVLVDALNPFGGGALFPLGRLREPLAELRRADVLLVTRSEYARTLESLERRLRRHNPRAPIFRARLEAAGWVNCATDACLPLDGLEGQPAGAFCGLGNPQSFWSTLEALGVKVVDRVEFGDHHAYRAHELRRLTEQFQRSGAGVALTTWKDMLNLCGQWRELTTSLPVYWLQVRMEIENEAEFLRAIESRLARQSPVQ
jgi:tetraacyldisaccharide 4'-kinase